MDKRIIIKTLDLLNFKGINQRIVTFNGDITNILGRNGSGKTTIFDAFTYVLFGKDSRDRKDFNIKTLDKNNQPIPDIPHEVTCVLDVAGEEIELRRGYYEKWTTKRGSAQKEFTGHEEKRFYNGVPCSVKEFAEKIAAICDETVFKFITSPSYFTAQKTDVQRSMLFRMAGEVSDAEIARGNADFEELLSHLTGKTLDEYKREIQAKKRRIKQEVESIPARIDERKRDAAQPEDWEALETELKAKKEQLADVEKQLSDIAAAAEAQGAARKEQYRKLTDITSKKEARRYAITGELMKEYNDSVAERDRINGEIRRKKAELARNEELQQDTEKQLQKQQELREALLAEYRGINAETLNISEENFTCPTCGRKYEPEEIEAKQQEISEKFQRNKAERLAKNKEHGLRVKAEIGRLQGVLESLKASAVSLDDEIEKMSENPVFGRQLQKPEVDGVVEQDKQYIELCNQETDLRNQLEQEPDAGRDNAELRQAKQVFADNISELKVRLSKRDVIAQNNARIAELETMLQQQSAELAELEGIEFTMAQFSKAKVNAVEDRINAMFQTVRFKMFEQQINCGEVETCEATVDGVPFSDLNNAAKINAGLDIINAICRSEGVYAPIFIDNAESVNELLPTQSQMVRLIVTEDEELVIE